MVGICPGVDFHHGLQRLTDAAFLSGRQSDTGNRSPGHNGLVAGLVGSDSRPRSGPIRRQPAHHTLRDGGCHYGQQRQHIAG